MAKKKETKKKTAKKTSAKFDKLIKEIESLSVVELANLVKELEERFGIDTTAMAAGGGAAASAGGEEKKEEEAEEKSEYTVELKSAGEKKIEVIKAIRTVIDMGLKDAKDLVDSAPKTIKENMPKEDAEKLKKAIESAGGEVELK